VSRRDGIRSVCGGLGLFHRDLMGIFLYKSPRVLILRMFVSGMRITRLRVFERV
jgi:hypothetical protein